GSAGGGSAGGGSAGGGSAGGCVPQGGTDFPDENGLDTNCDGVDGEAAQAAFVDGTNGLDTNQGTRAAPFRTIGRGLDAGRPQVLVASGTYTDTLGLGTGNFGIYGGYDPTASWARTATRPIITQPINIFGDGGTLALDFLRVATPNGSSSRNAVYALIVENVAGGVLISRSEFQAGRGAAGADGPTGLTGSNGGAGLLGGGGTDGGLGGNGGTSTCGVPGARGGNGGVGGGLDGEDGPGGGGVGGAGLTCDTPPCLGNSGRGGSNGADGGRGPDGTNGTTPGLIVAGRWSPVDGTAGDGGAPGLAGRPGGGGGAVFNPDAGLVARGAGAGGSGSGGCPGRGGGGGQSGGASIAALIIASSPTFDRCSFTTIGGGNGGNAGQGGLGGVGGVGGGGGQGEQLMTLSAGDGGVGGRGGNGGAGGNGGRGAGGSSIGVWCEGASTPVFTMPTFVIGTGGTGAVTGLSQQRHGTCP
ncbi:MAG: hypothetical protein ABTQ32_18950, partial [Myxococcaceae bacterium]